MQKTKSNHKALRVAPEAGPWFTSTAKFQGEEFSAIASQKQIKKGKGGVICLLTKIDNVTPLDVANGSLIMQGPNFLIAAKLLIKEVDANKKIKTKKERDEAQLKTLGVAEMVLRGIIQRI